MPAMVSLCAFQDKQLFDCMTFLNTSFYEASPGSLTFQYNPFQLVGSRRSISYGHCRGACGVQLRGGFYKTEYFILFIVFIFLLLIVPCASSPVTSVPLAFPAIVTNLQVSEHSDPGQKVRDFTEYLSE